MSPTTAEELSKHLLVPNEKMMPSQVAQVAHRQSIIDVCKGIAPGSKVLELGCGQGDCTVVLADAVGETGFVDAFDPAPPGYGSPFTVLEAHQHLSTTVLGPRIKWINEDPLSVLPKAFTEPKYDVGVLVHCLWYFSSPAIITATFERLRSLCKRIYVAEWALSASTTAAYPHVLAALTQASLECRKPESNSNVRTVVSPVAIRKLAADAGLKLVREGVVVPKKGLLDGRWEVSAVSSEDFLKEIQEHIINERERAVVIALRDAMLKSMEGMTMKDITSMDVWCGMFEFAKE